MLPGVVAFPLLPPPSSINSNLVCQSLLILDDFFLTCISAVMTTARYCKQKNCNHLLGIQRARERTGGFGCTSLDLPKAPHWSDEKPALMHDVLNL